MKEQRLGDVAKVVRGVTYPRGVSSDTATQGTVPILRAGNIQDELLLDQGLVFVPSTYVAATQFVKKNDILMCTSSGSSEIVGKSAIARDDWPGSFGAFNVGIRAGREVVPSFVHHYLRSPVFRAWTRRSSGANIKNIRKSELEALPIPLPPLDVQKKIAAVLDKADELRRLRRQAIAKLVDLAQSIFLEMFGDPVTNPKGWEVRSIGTLLQNADLLVHKDGNHGSNYPRSSDFAAKGVPFLTAKSIDDCGSILDSEVPRLRQEKASTIAFGWLELGDVLLAHNASVGKVGYYDGRYDSALIGTSLTAFRPSGTNLRSDYLFGALRSAGFQAQLAANMGQTTRNQVPITAQRDLSILMPPVALQESYARRLQHLQVARNKVLTSDEWLSVLQRSLTQRAFRGDLVS